MITNVLLGVIALVLIVGFVFFLKAMEAFAASHTAVQHQLESLQAASGQMAVHVEDIDGLVERIAHAVEPILQVQRANNSLLKGLITFEQKKAKKYIQAFGQSASFDEDDPFRPGVSKDDPDPDALYSAWLDEMQLPPREPEPGKRPDGKPFMPMPDRVIQKEAKALASQQRQTLR